MSPLVSSNGRAMTWVLLAGCLVAHAFDAAAQVGGTIFGSVSDPSGQAIAGALVEIRAADGSPARQGTTDATGAYRFVELAVRSYQVAASAPGFAESRQDGVAVHVDSAVRVDLTLAIAVFQQGVEVRGSVGAIDTTGTELGLVVDRDRISSLPLNRRDFLQLSLLAAGVAPPVQGSELSTRGAFAMHVNGGREEFNDFLLDGVDNNDPYVNRYVVQPPVDAISEFKVVTNSYSAEYGRNAAAQVNVVTRSGSDRLSGFGYEYFRDETLDARDYFASAQSPYRRDQAGVGVGGPVARKRVFFFGAFDYLRERETLTRLGTVPSMAQRSGDLSTLKTAIVDPFTRQPFAGNVVPASRISPVARQVLQAFPLPNREGPLNYLGEAARREDQVQGYARVDANIGSRDQVTFRYSQGDVSLVEPFAEGGSGIPGFGDEVRDRPLNATAQHQRAFGDRLLHALRFGFNRMARDIVPENHDVDVGAAWDVSWLDVPVRAFGYPVVNVAGYSSIGDTSSLPILRTTDTYHLVESLSFDRGTHLVRAGGEVRHSRTDGTLDVLTRGSLSFSGAISGAGISDLLLGYPSFGLQSKADNPVRLQSTALGVYVHDEWRVSPDVTVNLGLRYEVASPPSDPDDRMSALDTAKGQLVAAGALPSGATVSRDVNNLAPRVGAAWTVGQSTVVRAGYGLFYDAGMFTVYSTPYFNPPFFTLRVFFPTSTSLLTLHDPFPTAGGVAPPPSLNVLSPDLVTSAMHHWNATVERETGVFGAIRVAYAGSAGTHLVQARDLNQPPPAAGPLQARRPYPQFGNIFYVQSSGTSSYHALQVSVDRPLQSGWSLLGAYTLSKSLDENSAFLDTVPDRNMPQNSSHLDAERGPSSFDVRHRAVLALTLDLPRGNPVTRDMQFRALAAWQSGMPLTPVLRFDNSNTGNTGGTAGSDRPDVLGSTAVSSPSPERWFNTAAFSMAPRYSFGNGGRNVVRGPGYGAVDLALSRRVGSIGGTHVSFDVQVFNAFNRTNFDLPQLYVDEPITFGRILSARPARQIQLAARVGF